MDAETEYGNKVKEVFPACLTGVNIFWDLGVNYD